MAAHIIAEIYRRIQVSPAESLILQTIAYSANIQGQNARISYDAIAQRTGYSQRWTITLIHRLEEKCLLRIQRHRLTWASHEVNRYDIVRPWLREITLHDLTARKIRPTRTSEPSLQREDNTKKNPENNSLKSSENPLQYPSHEDCLKLGITPVSPLYALARGLPL